MKEPLIANNRVGDISLFILTDVIIENGLLINLVVWRSSTGASMIIVDQL